MECIGKAAKEWKEQGLRLNGSVTWWEEAIEDGKEFGEKNSILSTTLSVPGHSGRSTPSASVYLPSNVRRREGEGGQE